MSACVTVDLSVPALTPLPVGHSAREWTDSNSASSSYPCLSLSAPAILPDNPVIITCSNALLLLQLLHDQIDDLEGPCLGVFRQLWDSAYPTQSLCSTSTDDETRALQALALSCWLPA